MSLLHKSFLVGASLLGSLLCFLVIIGPSARISELAPVLPVKSQLFITDVAFIGWDQPASQLWMEQLPSSSMNEAGLVVTTDLHDGSHAWSDISMFHQLRCLVFVRQEMLSLARSLEYSQEFMRNQSMGSLYDIAGRCFDYIRQGLLCASDSTYIPSWHGEDAEGNGLWRQCRDNQPLYEWAQLSKRFGKPSTTI